jgi:hypothetical protein
MHGRLFLSALLLIVLASCGPLTRTTGASFTDPAWAGKTFPSFVVKVEGAKLAERQAIEEALAGGLQQAGLPAQGSLALLPPTRDYSDGQIRKRIADTHLSALLVVVPSDKEIVRSYVPGTYFPGNSITYPTGRGRFARIYEPGTFEPGYFTHEPNAYYNVSLYALPSFDKVWTADLRTEGADGMDFLDVGAHFANALVQRLGRDGLIVLPPQ